MAPSRSSVALDQWRGAAMLLVLVSHGLYFTGRVHGAGRVGVNLFFFISGVLVFRSLARRGSGGALAFWWRRVRRLYPALVAYVVLLFPVALLLHDRYSDAVPSALLYAIDYWPMPAPIVLGHLWSIAVEMQFYLVAPLIFLLGAATRSPGFVWGGLLGAFVLAGMAQPFLDPSGVNKYHFEFAVWPMMLGFCCEARKAWFQRLPAALSAAAARGCLIVFAGGLSLMVFGIETKTLVIACGALALVPCFLAYLRGAELAGPAGRLLAWVGQRTYSIYLWQQPLTIAGYLPAALHPAGAVVSLLVGGLSFNLFERPFLSSRRRSDLALGRIRRRPLLKRRMFAVS